MSATDNVIFVNTNTNSVTLTLPAPSNGRFLKIKDSTGNASAKNITIAPHSAETIDGGSSLVISNNYGEVDLVSDGTNWFSSANPLALAAVGSSPNANGASISGNLGQTLTLQPADGTHPGLLTSGAQTIGGNKTFTGSISASNFSGSSSGTNTGDQTITLTGDVTGSGTGSFAATIGSNVVTNAKLAQMPTLTLKGNNTGGTANALDLTVSQVHTMLGDVTTLAAVGASPNANGASISGNTLTLQPADGTNPGVLTAGTQTIGGVKTLTSPTINGGNITALATLAVRDTSAAFDVTLAATSSTALTAGRTITIDVKNASRAFNLQGDLTVSASATISGTNTGDVSLAAVGSSPNGNAASLSSQVLTLQPADGSNPGVLTAGAQTIGGNKTFNGIVGIAGATNTSAMLRLGSGSNPLTLASQYAAETGFAATSAATTEASGFVSFVGTAAAAFTCSRVLQFYATNGSKGAGSTITNHVMYMSDVPTIGSNNAILADNSSFSGNYFIHSTGANSSLFSASLQVSASSTIQDTSASLYLGNTGAAGADQRALSLQYVGNSSATGSVRGIQINISTAATAFTAAQALGVNVGAVSAGAGSTITRAVSYFSSTQSAGGTGNAVLADNLAFSGNYFINNSSANPSTFGGRIGVSGDAGSQGLIKVGLGGVNSLSGSTQTGVDSSIAGTSAATSLISAFIAQQNTAASAFTCSLMTGYYSVNQTKGAGSTITRQVSYYAETPTQGTNVAVLADNASFSGSFFINQSSTNPSAFGGNVAVTGNLSATKSMWAGGSQDTRAIFTSGNGTTGLTGSDQWGYVAELSGTSAATTTVIGLRTVIGTAAASFTCPEVSGVHIGQFSRGSGSAITYAISYFGSDQSAIGASNAAVLADNTSFSGNYFINSTSGSPSLFSSYMGIGGTNSFAAFTINPAGMTTALATTNAEGFDVEGAFPATATNSVTSFNAAATTTASAYTLNVLEQFVANNVTAGAGSTITRTINFRSVQPTSGTNNASFADNSSFTSNWFINQSGTTASTLGGNLRIGTTSAVNSTNEQLSVEYDVTAAATTDFCASTARLVISGNTAITGGQPQSGTFRFRRTTTGNVTENPGNIHGGLASLVDLNPSVGTTYTNTTSDGIATGIFYMPANIGAGTTAVSLVSGLYVRATASNTGTRAIGLRFDNSGTVTGATNTAAIADNISFSGNYFVHQAGTLTSAFGGNMQHGGNSNWVTGASAVASSVCNVSNDITITAGSNGIKFNAADNTAVMQLDNTNSYMKFIRSYYTQRTDVASASTITALASTTSYVRITGSTATALQGITAGQDGQHLIIFNNSGQNMTISNENAGATAANRIQTNTGADVTSTGNSGYLFIYDGSQSRWILISTQA